MATGNDLVKINPQITDFLNAHYNTKYGKLFVEYSSCIESNEQTHVLLAAPVEKGEIRNRIVKLSLNNRWDYFLSANTFTSPSEKRRKLDLTMLTNIVVSVQYHKDTLFSKRVDTKRKCSRLLETLSTEFSKNNSGKTKLPAPNDVVMTGRGLDLWWTLLPRPVHGKNAKILEVYRNAAIALCQAVMLILDKHPDELCDLRVNIEKSINPASLFRLPYTYNTYPVLDDDTGSIFSPYVEVIHIHETPADCLELAKTDNSTLSFDQILHLNGTSHHKKIPIPAEQHVLLYGIRNTFSFKLATAILALHNIRSIKQNESYKEKYFSYLVYAYYRNGFHWDEIWLRLQCVNYLLNLNVTDGELRSMTYKAFCFYSRRKAKFTVAYIDIITDLNVTDREKDIVRLYARDEDPELVHNLQREKSHKKVANCIALILCLNFFGFSKSEIAEISGFALSTIYRHIHTYERGELKVEQLQFAKKRIDTVSERVHETSKRTKQPVTREMILKEIKSEKWATFFYKKRKKTKKGQDHLLATGTTAPSGSGSGESSAPSCKELEEEPKGEKELTDKASEPANEISDAGPEKESVSRLNLKEANPVNMKKETYVSKVPRWIKFMRFNRLNWRWIPVEKVPSLRDMIPPYALEMAQKIVSAMPKGPAPVYQNSY